MQSLNTNYLSRLDHLRFYAAALVVLFHYFNNFVVHTSFDNPIASLVSEGHVGIGLFMVLSGFIFSVIAQNKNISYGRFIFNRFIRIYPLYIFAVFLAVTLMVYNEGQSRSVFDIIAWLLFFRPQTIAELPHFAHLWTIPVEFSFYLLFPFLHNFFKKWGLKYFLGILLLFAIIRLAVYIEFDSVRFLAYETLFGRLDQFLVGYICGWMFSYNKGYKIFSNWLTLPISLGVMLLLVNWMNNEGGFVNMEAAWWIFWPLVEGLMWAIVVLSYMYLRFVFPLSLDRIIAKLGEYSFSIYVVHMFVIILVVKHIPLMLVTERILVNVIINWMLVALPITLLVSIMTYYLIEKPFLQYRKQYTLCS